MFEKKYKIIFLRKEYSTLNLIKTIRTNDIKSVIRIDNRTYSISIDKPSYSEKQTKVFLFDFDSGSQFKFDEIKALLNPSELDIIVSNQIIKELTAGIIADKKQKMIDMILGAIIGGLFAALCMFFYMNSQINAIYESLNTTVVLP